MRSLFNSKCKISYYDPGALNGLGEPSRTLTERASDVPCRLSPRSRNLAYEFPGLIRSQREQGLIDLTTHILFVSAGQTLETHDIITHDDINYTAAAVVAYKPHHKEALLSRVTGK